VSSVAPPVDPLEPEPVEVPAELVPLELEPVELETLELEPIELRPAELEPSLDDPTEGPDASARGLSFRSELLTLAASAFWTVALVSTWTLWSASRSFSDEAEKSASVRSGIGAGAGLSAVFLPTSR
jgi:hypothetical protein